MIERNIKSKLLELASFYPVVTLTGPRQSGKTTLCKNAFPDLPHVSFEPLDNRQYASTDPRGFIQEYKQGAVLDEVQNVPDLLGYLQEEIDNDPRPGRFILTGSQHFGLVGNVSQSLAGRTGLLTLLPPSYDELKRFTSYPTDLILTMFQGSYPRIYDRNIPARRWLSDYVTTYVQRDVRQVLNVTDLNAFGTFLRLCAGHTACPPNLSRIGADAGISHNTARAWLSVLEASYICFSVPAWFRNVKKQSTKAPKLHFYDTGLVCNLLGITDPGQLRHHPLRGNIFETWVASEIMKAQNNLGEKPTLFHFRDAKGLEIDLVMEDDSSINLIEVKSGATISGDFFHSLDLLGKRLAQFPDNTKKINQILVYGGDSHTRRQNSKVIPWTDVGSDVGSGH